MINQVMQSVVKTLSMIFKNFKKELLKGTYDLIASLPRDILNGKSPGLFCLIRSVIYRETSASMITLPIPHLMGPFAHRTL